MEAEILFETRGAVLVITFNRPQEGNALTASMAKMLHEKLKAVSEDRALRAVLLRGAGDAFMNGHDMKVFLGDANAIQEQIFLKVQFFYTAIREFQAMERPVIAAVDGRVTGAGFSFMLASDFVVATQRTVFNAGYTPHAMVPDGGATHFLPRKVGSARASEILMLSEDFSAEAAERWGLVNKVVANDALQASSFALAEKLAAGPTRIYGATKRLIDKAFDQDLNAQLSLEATFWNVGVKTFDFHEAIKAHAAKREPKYTGA
ncbi:MAG: enoyl-CoA hydratase-related protein [Alphaproteobacteria bacterium]|nr:enoyl-CoA hydratase-related protein [Alphaproteobacteria bacterium]